MSMSSKMEHLEHRAMNTNMMGYEAVRKIQASRVAQEPFMRQTATEPENEVVLRKFDQGFEKWLRNKSEEELARVVSVAMRGHEFEADTKAYVECVQSMEHMVRNCSKCRNRGCEKCTYVHALRYVVRWQRPADWWKKKCPMGFVQGSHEQNEHMSVSMRIKVQTYHSVLISLILIHF